ncbi:hypothetical protein IH779_03075 [Patescibacteria group bacterium]|nr:hypothetical protein [Patescibacteria group bacterium]
MWKFDFPIKKPAVLAGAFLLFMFTFLPIFFLVILPELQKAPLPPTIIQESSGVFEGVPSNYSECIKTEEKYIIQKGLRLECQYTVWEEDEPDKFASCLKIGGRKITEISDTFGPAGSFSSNFCQILFYNPNYVFPENFNECEDENKGYILGGDGSTVEGILRPKTCLISIEPSKALNKEVATKLMNECVNRGGDYYEKTPGCIIKFNEPDTTSKISESLECLELTSGYNNMNENRIDLVLIGFDYTSLDKFINIIEQAIDFRSEDRGLFSLEPFKSNKHLFNIWYVATIANTQNQAKDTWDYSSLCRNKLGIEDHQFSPQEPLFSEKMFTLLIFNKEMPASFVYVGENSKCSLEKHNGRCGLKGLQMGITRDNPTKSNIHDFVHEFAHIFTFPNINEKYRPDEYYEILDEYARFPGAYSSGRDYMNIVKERSNCFVGTYEACMSQENTLFGDLIGDGCGKDGVIDCCTRDVSVINQGARSCESCPSCQEDSNYDLEISCYEGCWVETGIFRSTFRSIMSSRSGSQSFGKSNERLLCHQVQYLTGDAKGICEQW